MIVYLARHIPAFVMYCVNGESGSTLLIESTDSMIIYFSPSPSPSPIPIPSPSPSPEHYREIVSVPEVGTLLGGRTVCPIIKFPQGTFCTSVECQGSGVARI